MFTITSVLPGSWNQISLQEAVNRRLDSSGLLYLRLCEAAPLKSWMKDKKSESGGKMWHLWFPTSHQSVSWCHMVSHGIQRVDHGLDRWKRALTQLDEPNSCCAPSQTIWSCNLPTTWQILFIFPHTVLEATRSSAGGNKKKKQHNAI